MLRIPWTDHETNSDVLNQASAERHLLKTIGKEQAEIWGHVMRKSELEKLVISSKFRQEKAR